MITGPNHGVLVTEMFLTCHILYLNNLNDSIPDFCLKNRLTLEFVQVHTVQQENLLGLWKKNYYFEK
jgi:hypothetical protein